MGEVQQVIHFGAGEDLAGDPVLDAREAYTAGGIAWNVAVLGKPGIDPFDRQQVGVDGGGGASVLLEQTFAVGLKIWLGDGGEGEVQRFKMPEEPAPSQGGVADGAGGPVEPEQVRDEAVGDIAI